MVAVAVAAVVMAARAVAAAERAVAVAVVAEVAAMAVAAASCLRTLRCGRRRRVPLGRGLCASLHSRRL